MDDKELRDEIERHCTREEDRLRLSCHRAHVLAEDLGVTLGRIGRICNAHNIKIKDCQLGCFGSFHE